jgi:hypothetical protein
VGHRGDVRPDDGEARRIAKLLKGAGVELDAVHHRRLEDPGRGAVVAARLNMRSIDRPTAMHMNVR